MNTSWRAQRQFRMFAILALSAVLILTSCRQGAVPLTGAGARTPTFTISDESITTPAQVPSGIVTISGDNTTATDKSVMIARLNPDVTIEQFLEAFSNNPDDATNLVALSGGAAAPAGEVTPLTLDLKPGTHAVVSFEDSDAPPMVSTFEVADDPQAEPMDAPEANVNVDLHDFAFSIPATVNSGSQVWKVENTGEQVHEMIIFKLNEGVTQEQFMEFLLAPPDQQSGPPPGEDAAFFGLVSPGERGWVTLDLEPGQYIAVCFLPDPATGQPHFTEGMIASFEATAP